MLTQRTFVLTYLSGQPIGPKFKRHVFDWQLVPNVSGQPIGPETLVTTNLRCVTSYKGEDLIRTAA